MIYCVICDTELATPLETFGDIDAPMCQHDYLDLITTPDPYAGPFFYYTDRGGGWFEKRLTEAGAAFLEGRPDELMMLVKR